MENEEEKLSKIMPIRLKPQEYKLLDDRFKKTRFRKLSEYLRSVLLDKPITVNYRDKSMDEVLEELILLRRELNSIGNNLNQTVRNINSAHGNADSRLWLNLLNVISNKLEPAILQIKERMNKYAEIWSQKSRSGKA